MTNEQLGILIRNYALRLDEHIQKLDDELPEDMERHLIWVRKSDGKKYSRLALGFVLPDKRNELKQEPTGDFVCLDGLRQFSTELRTQVNELSAAEKLNAMKRARRLK